MAGHVSNPATKFEDPIRSRVMSHNVFHWIPRTLHFWLLRMCRITWPVRRVQILPTYLESTTPIYLFSMQLRWFYDECKSKLYAKIMHAHLKRRMNFCACTKSRALNALLQSFSTTSIYRIVLQKLSISSHLWPFQQNLYCACTQTVINILLV